MTAELGQAAPQLGLKNHNQRDGKKDGEAAHNPANDDEVEQS